jgi:outer membrane protein TolC
LAGSYTYSGNSRVNDYELFQSRQASLSLNWPLFNGFTRERNIAQQAGAMDVADATANDTRRQVSAALTQRFAELDAAALRIEISQTSVVAAEEDLRVQQERYRLGAATVFDVLTSQEALTQAEVDVVNARFDYLLAKAQIEALIGRQL